MRISPQRFLTVSLLLLTWSISAFGDFTLNVGPTANGGGGPNPISIPPLALVEYQVTWVTDNKREWVVSVIPGIFYGQRFMLTNSVYLGLDAGLVIDMNGFGPGISSALGYDLCGSRLCFNMEYRQALGVTLSNFLSPYALRIGMTWKTQ